MKPANPIKTFKEKHQELLIKVFMGMTIITWLYNLTVFLLSAWAGYFIFLTDTYYLITTALPSGLLHAGMDLRLVLALILWAFMYGALKR